MPGVRKNGQQKSVSPDSGAKQLTPHESILDVVRQTVREVLNERMSTMPLPTPLPTPMPSMGVNMASPHPAEPVFQLPKDREMIVNAHKNLHERHQTYKMEFNKLLETPPSAGTTYMQTADNLMNAAFEYIMAAENFARTVGVVRGG